MNDTPQGTLPSGRSTARQATMREFVAVVFRRRGIVIGLFVVVTATVAVLALTTPITYESSGRVLVYRGEQPSQLNAARQVFNDWEEDLASEQANARSQPVIEATRALLRKRALAAHRPAPALVEKNVDVQVMGKSNVLGIGYADRDPAVSRQVCDALLTAVRRATSPRSSTASIARFSSCSPSAKPRPCTPASRTRPTSRTG